MENWKPSFALIGENIAGLRKSSILRIFLFYKSEVERVLLLVKGFGSQKSSEHSFFELNSPMSNRRGVTMVLATNLVQRQLPKWIEV